MVIVQFNLDMDGRKAADDVREKVAAIRPLLREEVKEARVSRFDPASRPIYTLSLTSPDGSRGQQELTTFADQVVRKRLENVRGVGSVTLVGGRKREINIYLRPAAMDAMGLSVEQVLAAVRAENQELPAGTLRTTDTEKVLKIDARIKRPEDFAQIIVARKNGAPVRLGQLADVVDGPEELENLALFNGERTLVLDVRKSQGENTIEVVDGLNAVVAQLRPQLPKGMALEVVRDNSRPIRVSVKNVQRTLLEGALLTIGIVFLFLNSWRSTVITGLALPIALIGTFLFMYMFGFSINMVTLMALSLCVGLLIDDAIVVRENIVRHVQMGKSAHDAALEGTQEIGLAVLATTLSIVAVFLPIGFMGGIVGKFFHEFGITIVAAVLISMFVSFTLDPMLSSVWHDPAIHAEGMPNPRRTLYERSIGRITGAVDDFAQWLGRATPRSWPGRCVTSWRRWAWPCRPSAPASRCCPSSAPNSCPRPTTPRPSSTSTPRWARRSRSPKPRRGRSTASSANSPRCSTRWPRSIPARCWAATRCKSSCAWSTATSASSMSTRCRYRCASAWPRSPASR